MTNILFFDMDGTLIATKDGRQHIPASAIDGMREARMRGARSYLCTGRSPAEARTLGPLPIDGIIGASGGVVLDGDTMVSHHPLDRDAVSEVERWLVDHGFTYYMETNDGMYFDQVFLDYARRTWGIKDMSAWSRIVHLLDETDRTDINKVCFRCEDKMTFEEVREALGGDFYLVQSSFDDPNACAGELSVRGVTKATAIDELLAYLGIAHDSDVRTFGFGDSMNDLEMFQRCDEAIVMGDSRHDMFAHATFVTRPALEDGIAHALHHFGLA